MYEFDSFPHTLTGLESNTTYYFTIRSVCGNDSYSDWTDNGNDGPDPWTTTTCPSSYSLPYLNDFNDPVAGLLVKHSMIMTQMEIIGSMLTMLILMVKEIMLLLLHHGFLD